MRLENLIELAIAKEETRREVLAPLPWDEPYGPELYALQDNAPPYIPGVTDE